MSDSAARQCGFILYLGKNSSVNDAARAFERLGCKTETLFNRRGLLVDHPDACGDWLVDKESLKRIKLLG